MMQEQNKYEEAGEDIVLWFLSVNVLGDALKYDAMNQSLFRECLTLFNIRRE